MLYAIKCFTKDPSVASYTEPQTSWGRWWKSDRGAEAWCGGGTNTTTYDNLNDAFRKLCASYDKFEYVVEEYKGE